MNIVFVDINKSFTDAVKKIKDNNVFNHLKTVSTTTGSFEEAIIPNTVNCMVGAGNSFGALSGGVDLAIRNYFGFQIQNKLQQKIEKEFLGELLVGQSLVLETGNEKIAFLGYAPTMRSPKMILNTDIPYVATWSILTQIYMFNKTAPKKIETVIFPGMGTGTGKIPCHVAAKQMLYAVDNFFAVQEEKEPKEKGLRKGFVIDGNLKTINLVG